MKHYSFPSIEQFKNVRRNVEFKTQFKGLDEANEPIMDRNAVLPMINYEGTVKIHGCFEGETLITLANGEKEKIKNIKVGDSILSFDLNSKRFCPQIVLDSISQDLNKEWIRLVFDDSSVLDCTKDHKIFTKNRGWVAAWELSENDEFLKEYEEVVIERVQADMVNGV